MDDFAQAYDLNEYLTETKSDSKQHSFMQSKTSSHLLPINNTIIIFTRLGGIKHRWSDYSNTEITMLNIISIIIYNGVCVTSKSVYS